LFVSEHGSVATCHWCGIEGKLNFQEVWITDVRIKTMF